MVRDFQEMLKEGQVGESIIAQMLQAQGISIMPVYEKEADGDKKGPRVFGCNRQIIAPDMFAYNGDWAAWIEAKHKSGFTYSRRHGRYTTGIDLKCYLDYLRIADESPFPVWLMFVQKGGWAKDNPGDGMSPSGLYGGDLSVLRHCENHRHETPMQGQRHGMVYWAEESLTRFCDVPPSAGQGRIDHRPLPRLAAITRSRKRSTTNDTRALEQQLDEMYAAAASLLDELWKRGAAQ